MLAALVDTFNAIASPIAAVVLNALWEGPLLVVAVWLLVRTWPQINASTRYAIWCTTLAAVVIVPIATTLPFFTLTTPSTPSTATASTATTSSSPKTTAKALRVGRAPKVTHALTTRLEPASTPAQSTAQLAALPPRFRVTFPLPLAIGVFALWAVLALVALVRLAIGLVRLEQLKRDALPLPLEYRDAMDRWARANKGSREVRLCVSDETDVPVAVGLFDAMILIPRSLLELLSATEVDQISLHELAHLRRGDDWTNGFQRIALALLAWNPAALFVSQQLDLEREVACDDWVLSLTGTVRPYAMCLTKMAETSAWPRQPIPAPGVFATRKHISLRIERLLGAGRNIATTLAIGPAAIAIAIVATLSLAIAAVAPSVAAPCLQALSIPPPVVAVSVPAPKIQKIIVFRSAPPLPAMPATNVRVPATNVRVPATNVRVPATNVHVPATNVHVPETNVRVPEIDVRVPAANVHVPAMNFAIPHVDVDSIVKSTLKGMPLHRMVAQSALGECSGCDYSGANWAGKDVRNRNFTGVDLSNSNLQGADFSSSHLSGVDFTHANLRGAKFHDAQLVGCDFSGANLVDTDFSGAKLSGCQFTGAQMTSSEIRAILNTCTGCDFSKANLSGIDLSGVRTSGIDFSGANLSGANLSGSEFVGDDFSGAKFDGARLDGTTFNGCDLSGVDLSRVDLSKTKMIGTDFSVRRSPEP